MLRLAAFLAVLVNLLASALPAGALLHVAHDGTVAVESASCCAMGEVGPDLSQAHGQSRAVHCCCFTGFLVGHDDAQLALLEPVSLPSLPPVAVWWAGVARPAASAARGFAAWRDHPPPLGLARLDTIVIRC